MEHLLGGFQMPFQRRLTKLYTDTKGSYEFVKEPVQSAEDPDISALHRKLRIQKDRLVSWGLDWSDSSKSADIDESISRAGLVEVVGSVMSTIKDILAEAEPLWNASKRSFDGRGEKSEKSGDSKLSLVTWDRNRFEELMKDLTTSIDTLYDLSRTRQNARQIPTMKHSSSNISFNTKAAQAEQARLFESSRMKTPQQIDASSLVYPRNPQTAREFPSLSGTFSSGEHGARQVVYMRVSSSSTAGLRKSNAAPALSPVLLEYSAYDPIYASTGITPEMDRFEKLFAGLQTTQGLAARQSFGTLSLIGYFEDTTHARFGLLFELPPQFSTWDFRGHQLSAPGLTTLDNVLSQPATEPALEVKFRLAHNVASTVVDLHSKGITHGDINTSNINFLEQISKDNTFRSSNVNLRCPFITSFDLFPENAPQPVPSEYMTASQNLYRHPLDPRLTPYTRLTSESRSLDLYSLGIVLMEVGLWKPLSMDMQGRLSKDIDWGSYYKQLSKRCGSLYSRIVQACLKAAEDETRNASEFDNGLHSLYDRISSSLERCCAIDDEEGDGYTQIQSLIAEVPTSTVPPYDNKPQVIGVHKSQAEIVSRNQKDTRILSGEKPVRVQSNLTQGTKFSEESAKIPKPALRLFPAVEMETHHWEVWNKVLMPAINKALKGFYRKYPESVEISLERIGETANTTKPTILVVCTSVGKVRSILKKHFSYDTTTYGLLVCRGRVFRSRKNQPRRSAAGNMAMHLQTPENPDYHERPFNGASIGAFVEGQHLPPVSFGGLVMVGDKPYGLTVHHMLDDPALQDQLAIVPSSGTKLDTPALNTEDDEPQNEVDGYAMSEHGSDYSEASSDGDVYSDADDDDEYQPQDAGDIEGIPEGCGDGYAVTQPALDDVDEGFYPDEETIDQDHLESYGLGEIYASSGIRRRRQDGIAHEIDWALFEFNEDRQPPGNYIKGGEQHCRIKERYPVEIASWSSLHGLEIHCSGRTTGLQKGRILPGMTIVKIFGRQTPSQSYQVSGRLGVPGDSGAWIIDNKNGRACGHVLAWSSRKQVAYICPMEIILADISDTLNASVSLPPGKISSEPENSSGYNQLAETRATSAPDDADAEKTVRFENTKHLASVRYSNPPDDDIVGAMHGMHISHGVISQS